MRNTMLDPLLIESIFQMMGMKMNKMKEEPRQGSILLATCGSTRHRYRTPGKYDPYAQKLISNTLGQQNLGVQRYYAEGYCINLIPPGAVAWRRIEQ